MIKAQRHNRRDTTGINCISKNIIAAYFRRLLNSIFLDCIFAKNLARDTLYSLIIMIHNLWTWNSYIDVGDVCGYWTDTLTDTDRWKRKLSRFFFGFAILGSYWIVMSLNYLDVSTLAISDSGENLYWPNRGIIQKWNNARVSSLVL